jgi:PAS domain S-box-containing protein
VRIQGLKSTTARSVALALVYFVVARASLSLAIPGSNASPVWPPSGIALAAVLLLGWRVWPGIAAGAFAANLVTFLGHGAGWPVALPASAAIALGNAGEALAAQWIVRRFAPADGSLSLQRAFVLLASALCGAMVSSAIGVSALSLLAIIPREIVPVVWFTWWLGDVTGILVITPIFLALAQRPALPTPASVAPILIALLASATLVFSGQFAADHLDRLLALGLVVVIAWSALRHGWAGAALASFGVAAVSVAATIQGAGPFSKATVNDSLVSLDGFLFLATLTGLMVAGGAPGRTARSGKGASALVRHLPLTLLLAGVGVTLVSWHLISRDTETRAAADFHDISNDIQHHVLERMQAYEQILRGARAMVELADGRVTGAQWHAFVETLALGENYPGVQGMSYAALFPAADLERQLASVRAQGIRDFAIRPPGLREEYGVALYVEPPERNNKVAIGFDLYSEPYRHAAMAQARDTGDVAVTGKLRLVSEVDVNAQAGFLMFEPVYRRGLPLTSVAQRRAAILGFVYFPFRMDDLMQSTLRDQELAGVSLSVFDGVQTTPDARMFANRASQDVRYPHQLSVAESLPIGPGHWWTAVVRTTGDFEANVDTQKAQITLIAGSAISFLIFGLMNMLSSRREDALRLAERMGASRAEAMARLEQAQIELKTLVEATPALVGSWDRDMKTRFLNNEYREWLGIDPVGATGKHIRDVLGAELFTKNLPYIERAMRGERVSFERTLTNPAGRSRHAQIIYIPDVHDGELRGCFALAFDITQQKETEQALEHGLRLHNAIFTHAGVGIASVREGQFERVSRRLTELLGYAEGELDDRPCATIFPDPASYERVSAQAGTHLASGRTFELELPLRRNDGRAVWCRMLQRAIEADDPGQGTIWIIEDFRDRRQRETLMQEAHDDAQAAAKLKADFLANMSHEIRTPMNAIMGMTSLTLDTELDPGQRENLQIVQNSAQSLLRLVDDILDFSKLEAGKMRLAPEDFDLRDGLASTLQRLAPQAAVKGIELVLDVAPDVPAQVHADSGRLMQVVTNLCGNAIKFTHHGHVICRVSLHGVPGDALTLAFAVEDTGIGIPDSARERIFESFVQADSSVTRQYGGTGLGLAISAQIVELMQGRIGVESRVGAGTIFRFTVQAGRVASPSEHSVPGPLTGHHVALVVPDRAARAACTQLLSSWEVCTSPFRRLADVLDAVPQGGAGFTALVCDERAWESADETTRARCADLVNGTSIVLGYQRSRQEHRAVHVRKPVRPADLFAALAQSGKRANADTAHRVGEMPPATPAVTTVPVREAAARPLQVLVAEDHEVNQKLVRRILERRGHAVTMVADGAQAVAAAIQGGFDVVLMDVQMPGMDGIAATRAIRDGERAGAGHIPIIALTAHALQGERERLLGEGMDDYMSKPFDPHQLIEAVERWGGIAMAVAARASAPEGDSTASARQVIDYAQALEGVLGDAAFLREMAHDFSQELPRTTAEMGRLFAAGDLAAMARAAHRLKGVAGNFRALETVRAALALESACATQDAQQVPAAWQQLQDELTRLTGALEALRTAQEA